MFSFPVIHLYLRIHSPCIHDNSPISTPHSAHAIPLSLMLHCSSLSHLRSWGGILSRLIDYTRTTQNTNLKSLIGQSPLDQSGIRHTYICKTKIENKRKRYFTFRIPFCQETVVHVHWTLASRAYPLQGRGPGTWNDVRERNSQKGALLRTV